MPTETSHRHVILSINGERVTGLAAGDAPVTFESIPLNEITWGADGTMYVHGTARKGGPVMVKLLPTSKFAATLLRWRGRITNDERLEFAGSYADPQLGFACTMRGGVLTECPPMLVPNTDFEATFTFEELVSEADAASFSSVPGIA